VDAHANRPDTAAAVRLTVRQRAGTDEDRVIFAEQDRNLAAQWALAWLAHTQYQYTTMLLARDQPGAGEKAGELLKSALLTARELGMRALEERITSRP